jgi:DNA-binding response OmpR family regulator
MRLLLVEDEVDLVETVRPSLVGEGYALDVALDLAGALDKLRVNAYDLLVLDLSLPDGDGFELCGSIRRGELDGPNGQELRILMLTARAGLRDRVRGLDEGADDYLVKPFSLGELLARLRALLRRDSGQQPDGATLRVGELRLDPARHEVFRGERPLRLTRKEFGVLEYLMARPGLVVHARELQREVWDEHADPLTETVRVTVGNLRRKLNGGGESPLVETIPGKGYRLRAAT